jgi:pimeloyl-ACP methyl ester carboxylesterase
MPNATVNGVEIDYEISGSGVPALFIHGGFGGPATTLVAQNRNDADLLPADKVMTISYDRRGAGQSEYTLSHYTVADLAADARALLAHLGINRSIIVGSSMGGMVAQQYALDYPQHVEALALINTGTNLMDATALRCKRTSSRPPKSETAPSSSPERTRSATRLLDACSPDRLPKLKNSFDSAQRHSTPPCK